MLQLTAFAKIHNRWLETVLEQDPPPETYSTCSRCPMCDPSRLRPASRARPFATDTKCCTYWPDLPNYLVGSALADESPEAQDGKQRIAGLLVTDLAVPRGLGVSREYQMTYRQFSKTEFGDRADLKCPFYKAPEGHCSIWAHRTGVCATWFCKPQRGAVGETFWERTKMLLHRIERSVSLWCALELGVPLSAARVTPRAAALEVQPDDGRFAPAQLWGAWGRRREDYYRACFERAVALSWSDVRKLGGIELDALVASVRAAFEDMVRPAAVRRVISGPVQITGRTETDVFLQSYRESDPQQLDARLFHALRHAQGQPVEELRATALRDDGVDLDDRLVRRLVDLKILIQVA